MRILYIAYQSPTITKHYFAKNFKIKYYFSQKIQVEVVNQIKTNLLPNYKLGHGYDFPLCLPYEFLINLIITVTVVDVAIDVVVIVAVVVVVNVAAVVVVANVANVAVIAIFTVAVDAVELLLPSLLL